MTTKAQLSEQGEAIAKLRDLLPPGTVVMTILRHVSRSGMSRSISCVIPAPDDSYGAPIFDITWLVARALGGTIDQRHGGIKRGGCGMDMCWDLVYSLSRTLYPSQDGDGGYTLTQRHL
jgi:hypothetical protein